MYARRTVVCEPAAHPRTLGNGTGTEAANITPLRSQSPFRGVFRARLAFCTRVGGAIAAMVLAAVTVSPAPRGRPECSPSPPPPPTPRTGRTGPSRRRLGSCWGRSARTAGRGRRAAATEEPLRRQDGPVRPCPSDGRRGARQSDTLSRAIDWMRKADCTARTRWPCGPGAASLLKEPQYFELALPRTRPG